MHIMQKIRHFIYSNIELAFWEMAKTREKKILLNEKTYKNLSKIAPRLANKLLWTEEVQTEDPYKIFVFISLLTWACWVSCLFLLIVFLTYWYIFEPYNQLVLNWFVKFWPKKIIWIYGKWFLNKKEFLTKRAFVYVMLDMLTPIIIINFLYLLFDYLTWKVVRYRLIFFICLFLLLFGTVGLFFFDLSYIFIFKNIFWSLELTLQDTPKHVTEVNFIIFDQVDFWFFTILKFYSFMSYYSVHILIGFCSLLFCIAYTEWCHFFRVPLNIDSEEFYRQIEHDIEIDEIIENNRDHFDNNK